MTWTLKPILRMLEEFSGVSTTTLKIGRRVLDNQHQAATSRNRLLQASQYSLFVSLDIDLDHINRFSLSQLVAWDQLNFDLVTDLRIWTAIQGVRVRLLVDEHREGFTTITQSPTLYLNPVAKRVEFHIPSQEIEIVAHRLYCDYMPSRTGNLACQKAEIAELGSNIEYDRTGSD